MKLTIIASLLICFMGTTAWVSQEKQPKSTLSTKSVVSDSGKIIYETYCLACHQEDGSGVPNMNPPLIKTDWVLGDSTRLINVILKGLKGEEINGDSYSNEMPAHDFLSDKQIADVLTFVRNSFGNKASAIKPEYVKSQRQKKK
ncbi:MULTISPECIES: cytochrome c [unclassified Arcicella]|uniref:c-type cytochrome n=1 Tax=unclassified Arcicella TaxID=2644986 RepID=UPI0028620673|nr:MULTISPECIES: cytochrome c [unclassified Arcicella]MDR6562297.1 mono/diheme cytochrome c family protein [Arcicella sp. BE51]MDR6812008.1 mono/diheme cytochrome c family protein [Arcicella sp. BE140]MDR6823319.1 mono/diheme cytochrome c family protein [Arcicella sp. BE139]